MWFIASADKSAGDMLGAGAKASVEQQLPREGSYNRISCGCRTYTAHSKAMSAGLSLADQVEEYRKSGIETRAGDMWEGKLEEWLDAVLPPGAYERYGDDEEREDGPGEDETVSEWTDRKRAGIQTWCFPTSELRTEYLASVADRSEADVFALLRLFLFEESCFGGDSEYLHRAIHVFRDISLLDTLPVEYRKRLLAWMGGNAQPHPSIRWAIDLLPHSPQQAIDAIGAYLRVYSGVRPEGRSNGLMDAMAVIRARWIENLGTGLEVLFRLSPRDLEILAAALFRRLGYAVELTPPSADGGRDVIATKTGQGQNELLEIECKTHTRPVGVDIARQLQGVVARSGANRGVLITIGRFTRGARELEKNDHRLELVDGSTLIQMLNSVFGPLWVENRERICWGLS
ncbi:restriction endonuclease [Nocardia tengchongensis]|uniref:restriction endonuclease n=1 Tax=Nocardia tengchongensis TaxID=2055889 RepID=UPI003696FDAD